MRCWKATSTGVLSQLQHAVSPREKLSKLLDNRNWEGHEGNTRFQHVGGWMLEDLEVPLLVENSDGCRSQGTNT